MYLQLAPGTSDMLILEQISPRAQGMSITRLPNGKVAYEGSMQSRMQRLRISISIAALRSLWWLGSTGICLWHNVTSVLLGTDAYALHPA